MNHDPLCPNQHDPDPKCHACHLIDMARQDERRTVLDAAREAVKGALIVDSNGSPERGDPWNAAIGVAVEYLALLNDQPAMETA